MLESVHDSCLQGFSLAQKLSRPPSTTVSLLDGSLDGKKVVLFLTKYIVLRQIKFRVFKQVGHIYYTKKLKPKLVITLAIIFTRFTAVRS